MTDKKILEIEDCLTSRVNALEVLLKTQKQKSAISSSWESIVEWSDMYHALLGE